MPRRRRHTLAAVLVAVPALLVLAGAAALLSAEAPPAAPAAPIDLEDRVVTDARGAFRLALTPDELAAVLVDASLAASVPLRGLELDLVGDRPTPVELRFDANIDRSRVPISGVLELRHDGAGVDLAVRDLRVGRFGLPAAAREGIDQLIAGSVDLDVALAEQRIRVTLLEVRDGRIVLEGTAADPDLVTLTALRDALQQSRAATSASPVPAVPAGVTAERRVAGSPVHVALGDSLAAATGLGDLRDGYVWRVHGWLRARDGQAWGLENFGVPGATTRDLRAGAQLRRAVEVLAGGNAGLVTIDVGGNDLLGELRSGPCAAGVTTAACTARVQEVAAAHATDLGAVLAALRSADADVPIVVLTPYNPFDLGVGSDFERATDDAVMTLSARTAETASAHGANVADGRAALAGSIGTTTGVLGAAGDVHPTATGHERLAGAIVAALEAT